jgi:hypothetical protein
MSSRRFATSIEIAASPEEVWDVLSDVVRWPEWTESVSRVQLLDAGPLDLGSRVRITQPKLPVTVWEVAEFAPGVSFTWAAKHTGISTVAGHHVIADARGGTTVVLSIEQSGVLAPLVWLATRDLTRRYVGMEARGLKKRAEQFV